MKVLSTEGLTKLIDLIKSNFISSADTQATVAVDAVETTAVDAVETSVATLATVATTGSYNDLSDKPSTRNIGEVITSTIPLSDAGLHLLDGSLIQSGVYTDFVDYIAGLVSDYPDLFVSENDWQTAVTTYGVCGKFVYDSTNNTVRLPKITGFIEGTTDVTALGDLVEAGLPNITGRTSWLTATGSATSSGAIYWYSTTNHKTTRENNTNIPDGLAFDASRSNSIYGNSNTVQPQAIKVLYYIVMATSTKTDIEVDIDEIITDLNSKADNSAVASAISGKANTDLSNISGTSTSCIDGQWVPLDVVIANSVTWNSSSTDVTYNIASYLPSDSYNYEVLITSLVQTADSTSKFMTVQLKTDIQTSNVYVASIRTTANVVATTTGVAILPVGTGRTITQYSSSSSNANGTYSIYLRGYRRVGTNT